MKEIAEWRIVSGMKLPLFVFFSVSVFAKPLEVQIKTPHAILMNAKTGKILYEKNAREEVFPASTTKVATILYILKKMPDRLDTVVKCTPSALKMTNEQAKRACDFTMPAYWLEPDGTSARLVVGEEMTIRELLFGSLLASGNDASNLLAEHVCKEIPTFVSEVNEMAAQLGCQKTHFMNPHGLHHPMHKTCAYDMALITREALNYPIFREVASFSTHKRPKTNKQSEGLFTNANALIRPGSPFYYPKAFGIKTGRTKLSGYNIVAAAKDGDRELIVVLHKAATSGQRFRDAIQLFEKAFQEKVSERLLFAEGDTTFSTVVPRGKGKLFAETEKDVFYRFYPSEEEIVKTELRWLNSSLPIRKGDKVAEIEVKGEGGQTILIEPLFAANNVHKRAVYRFFDLFTNYIIPSLLPLFFFPIFFFSLRRASSRSYGR